MKWKLNEDGSIVVKDGNPVAIESDGGEKTIAVDTITRLNLEAQKHRESKEDALNKLKLYDGIDPVKAREAFEKISKFDEKQLVDAGKIDELKNQITSQYEIKLSEKDTAFSELQKKYDDLIINNVFANSKFIRDNVAVPRDLFEAKFRNNFKIENGEIIITGNDGNRLYSKERAGEYATSEEALRILAESHAEKEMILKANPGNGSGSDGGAGGHGNGGRYIKRSDIEKLPALEQAKIYEKVRNKEMTLTD